MAQPAPVKPPRPAGGRLRIGLIGTGDISQYHLAAWRKDARAAAFAIPGVYADAAAMLASEKPDAVDIATWRETHVELAQLAAAHGVHVLCQKPLAPTKRASTPLSRTSSGNYCRACRSRPAPTIICRRLNSSKTRMRWRRFSAAACRDSGTFPCDRT